MTIYTVYFTPSFQIISMISAKSFLINFCIDAKAIFLYFISLLIHTIKEYLVAIKYSP
jgi:hypothetical protein